jgi:hypothetical protein
MNDVKLTTPIIAYRNPVEMWFWEGGWIYVCGSFFVLALLFFSWWAWCEYKAKQRRKKHRPK